MHKSRRKYIAEIFIIMINKPEKEETIKEVIILAGIVLLGFILRVIYLGADSYWYDEANSICFTEWPLNLFTKHFNFTRPVYFLILKAWVWLFGISEVPSRFLSVLFGTLSVFAVFKLAKLMIDKKTAYIASLLMAVSFLQVLWARTVKLYAFCGLLSILSCYYFLKFIKFRSRRDLFLCSLLTSICILTHPYAVFLFLIQAIFVLIDRKNIHIGLWLKYQLPTFLAIIMLFFSFVIYSPFKMVYELTQTTCEGLLPRILLYLSQIDELLRGLTFGGLKVGHGGVGFPAAEGSLLAGHFLYVIYIILFLVGTRMLLKGIASRANSPTKKTGLKADIFLLFWFFIPLSMTILVNFWIPSFLYPHPRYFVFNQPALIIISAVSIRNIYNRFFKYIVILAMVAISVFYLDNIYMVRHYETWRDIGSYVRANIKKNDAIVLIPFGQITSFWIYYKDKDKMSLRYITKDGVYNKGKWAHSFKDGETLIIGNAYKRINDFIAEDNFSKLAKEKKNFFLILSPYWEEIDNAAFKFYNSLPRYYHCVYKKYYFYNGVSVEKWDYRGTVN